MDDRYDQARVQVALDRLLTAPVTRVQVRPLLADAWGWRHNLTIADAVYVVLAERLGAPLVTSDLMLARAPGLPVATITP